jgi:cation diffusion facilitator family transporter
LTPIACQRTIAQLERETILDAFALNRSRLMRYAWLSIAAALVTMGLKGLAYWLTGSVGLLSDALESSVNLFGALMALAMLSVAARPPDEEHAYGHSKAEYFSSGFEGSLILVAAVAIAIAAVNRLLHPQPLEQVGLGLAALGVATLVNLLVARVLVATARNQSSVTLEASASHLMSDVWTSVGVIAGVVATVVTGWVWIDPLIALCVAGVILKSGIRIVWLSIRGLSDSALPTVELERIRVVLDRYESDQVQFHALRTREAGARRFVTMHVLVPGEWTVDKGHELLERIEADLRGALPNLTVFTHMESLNDPASWQDMALDRSEPPTADASPG